MQFVLGVLVVFAVIVGGAYLLTGSVEPLFEGPLALHHMLILALLLSSLAAARPSWRVVVRSILLWGGIGLVALVAYTYRNDLQIVASRVGGELVPGRAVVVGDAVELVRRGDGHFHALAEVDGTTAEFLVDSGASIVVLTYQTAVQAEIDVSGLPFVQPVQTANGQTRVARIMIDELRIGAISKRNVLAAVAQEGDLESNLLGLSFLNRLSEWGVQNNRLIMKP